jgi:hypothetical protein
MTVIFALFFLLVGFIAGFLIACNLSFDLIRDHAKKGKTFLDKYRVTLISDEDQQE